MKISHKIGTAALVAAITIGGTTAAFAAGDNGGDGTTKAARIATLCEHKDEIVPKLTERQSNLTERVSALQELETKATDNGNTKIVARIEKRIDTLQDRLDKVGTRLEKAPAFIAEHCPA
jgi:hypothetical protein